MDAGPLQPQIDEAQKALQVALEEACSADLAEVDTGELIRIEETLAAASKAAKDAVSLRLKRRSHRARAGTQEPASRDAGAEDAPITHRVFEDIRGKRWHAFAVRGSMATAETAALPDAFRNGWLVFESADELRRVAPIPEKWEELATDDLRLLCHRASAAPRRTGK